MKVVIKQTEVGTRVWLKDFNEDEFFNQGVSPKAKLECGTFLSILTSTAAGFGTYDGTHVETLFWPREEGEENKKGDLFKLSPKETVELITPMLKEVKQMLKNQKKD